MKREIRWGKRLAALFCALLLYPWTGAPAKTEEAGEPGRKGMPAEELTGQCTFETNGKNEDFELLRDHNMSTYFPFREKKGILTVNAPSPVEGISVMLHDKYGQPLAYDLQVPGNGEEWVTVAQGGEFLAEWHELKEPTKRFRLAAACKERMRIAELRVFGPGEKPEDVQCWSRLEKCDMMLLSAHPDDEILWFGGLLPTYAGDRKLRLQVSVLVPTGGTRKLELLSALWHCGVRYYPEMLNFLDKNGHTPEKQYTLWKGKNRVLSRIVEVIRKHKPEVLITHGVGGEYGHGAHRTAADAAKEAIRLSAKKNKFSKSAKEYGTWEVKKLYLHEYEKNPIQCDWSIPLSSFGGKTGYEVAGEAFAFHASQVARDWGFEVHGAHDNAAFGLYYTSVGPDSGIGDLMEHIPAEE